MHTEMSKPLSKRTINNLKDYANSDVHKLNCEAQDLIKKEIKKKTSKNNIKSMIDDNYPSFRSSFNSYYKMALKWSQTL